VDDEDDLDCSQTQPAAAGGLSEADLAALAASVVRYVLSTQGRSAPLKRDKIRKLAEPLKQHRVLSQVLEAANGRLEHVFGMSLVELKNKDLALLNKLPVALTEEGAAEPHVQLADREEQRRGLLMVVLALIFMNNEPVKEDLLWPFLKKLNMEPGKSHECFDDVKKLLTQEFVQAQYLRVEKLPLPGGQTVLQFHWGERAYREVQQQNLLKFVCEMWGENTEPHQWTEQYQRVLEQQEAQEQE